MKRFLFVAIVVFGWGVPWSVAKAVVISHMDAPGVGTDLPFESVAFSMLNFYSSSTPSRPKPVISDLTITREQDAASTGFLNAALSGSVFDEVEIRFCTAVGPDCDPAAPATTLTLSDAMIGMYIANAPPSGGGVPTETLSLNFDKITWKYWPIGPIPSDAEPGWGLALPPTLPAGGMEPYQFDFMLDAPLVESLFDRPLSPLGDGLPETLRNVNAVPEPGAMGLFMIGLAAVVAGPLRRVGRKSPSSGT